MRYQAWTFVNGMPADFVIASCSRVAVSGLYVSSCLFSRFSLLWAVGKPRRYRWDGRVFVCRLFLSGEVYITTSQSRVERELTGGGRVS